MSNSVTATGSLSAIAVVFLAACASTHPATAELPAPSSFLGVCTPLADSWMDPPTTIRVAQQNVRPVNYATASPRYPPDLREAGVAGDVVASVVIDTTGRVDARSVRILRTTDARFSFAVCNALPNLLYHKTDGTPINVPSRVDLDFVFRIAPRRESRAT